MPDIVVTNMTATPLGLYDVDGSYVVIGALGGFGVIDPDTPSAEIIGIYTSSGSAASVPAAVPENTVAPVATGADLTVGQTVTCAAGTWTGAPAPVITYQWQVSDGEGWADIEGADESGLALSEGLIGGDVRCVVTGTNAVGDDTATSNPLGPVLADEG